MKRYNIKLLLTILVFTSCSDTHSTTPTVIGQPTMEINKITYEGHSYIWIEKWSERGGVTHDMNCKCFKYLYKNNNSKILITEMENNIRLASPDGK